MLNYNKIHLFRQYDQIQYIMATIFWTQMLSYKLMVVGLDNANGTAMTQRSELCKFRDNFFIN